MAQRAVPSGVTSSILSAGACCADTTGAGATGLGVKWKLESESSEKQSCEKSLVISACSALSAAEAAEPLPPPTAAPPADDATGPESGSSSAKAASYFCSYTYHTAKQSMTDRA